MALGGIKFVDDRGNSSGSFISGWYMYVDDSFMEKLNYHRPTYKTGDRDMPITLSIENLLRCYEAKKWPRGVVQGSQQPNAITAIPQLTIKRPARSPTTLTASIRFESATGSVLDSSSRKITQLPRFANAAGTTIALLPSSSSTGEDDIVDRSVWTNPAEQSYDALGPSSSDLFVPAIIERRKAISRGMTGFYNEQHDSRTTERQIKKRKLMIDGTEDAAVPASSSSIGKELNLHDSAAAAPTSSSVPDEQGSL
jgi:hypothetical protein